MNKAFEVRHLLGMTDFLTWIHEKKIKRERNPTFLAGDGWKLTFKLIAAKLFDREDVISSVPGGKVSWNFTKTWSLFTGMGQINTNLSTES